MPGDGGDGYMRHRLSCVCVRARRPITCNNPSPPSPEEDIMNHHDPADCHLADCQRCDDYGLGYSAGKDKAAFNKQNPTWDSVK